MTATHAFNGLLALANREVIKKAELWYLRNR